mgnify:CR=1 FL=1
MSVASSKKAGKKGREKPAWAQTEKMQEEAKEAEIDELLEFAYELDYEKYMEDYDFITPLRVEPDVGYPESVDKFLINFEYFAFLISSITVYLPFFLI